MVIGLDQFIITNIIKSSWYEMYMWQKDHIYHKKHVLKITPEIGSWY